MTGRMIHTETPALPVGWVEVETRFVGPDDEWESDRYIGPVVRETDTFIDIEVDGAPMRFGKHAQAEIRGPGRA